MQEQNYLHGLGITRVFSTSMLLLWITGGTLDVMAAIGFIVILGLIVDDPILKIGVLNRLEKKYAAEGLKKDDALLERMIHEAGAFYTLGYLAYLWLFTIFLLLQ